MNDIDKLDLIIEHLCKTKSRINHNELGRILDQKISEEEARQLFKRLIKDGFVERFGNQNSDEFMSIKCTDQTQIINKQGGYKSLEKLQEASKIEQDELSALESSKLRNEAKLAKWKVYTFWILISITILTFIWSVFIKKS